MSGSNWQRIEDVFHQAADLAPEARPSFLNVACGSDEALRKEVESLLAHDAEDGSTLGNAVDAAAGEFEMHGEDLSGTDIGPYHVLERIGAGGMGTVFKAFDTRLHRGVAIKVCRENFSGQFIEEARAVAALNHPHVCTLHDVGPNYLVMELIEGRPLKGPMAAGVAVEYALQILGALDAAHRKGITHRDLKPGNLLLTQHGIKLLDFGLARHASAKGVAPPAGRMEGIAGTRQYMAPEQLAGLEADARSDIFAFGCVLYEMLAGQRAFGGTGGARELAALPESQPAFLDRVIRTCLAPDPENRFQTAADLKRAMEWWGFAAGAEPWKRSRRPWMIAGLATAVTLAVAAVHFLGEAKPAPLTTFTVFPEEKTAITGHVAIAPDGRRITFVARDATGNRHLWLRKLDSAEARRMPGTDGAYFPAWSPDGRWIGFGDPYKLKKVEVESGQVFQVADAGRMVRGLSWGPDGNIYFATQASPIRRVAADGGFPEPLTTLDLAQGEIEHEYPWVLPGGKRLLFFVNSNQARTNGIWVGRLDKPADRKRVLPDSSAAAYASGHVLFVRNGALMAQPFDSERGQPGGAAEAVAPKIGYSQSGDAAFSVSASGVLVWSPVHSYASNSRLTWFDRNGAKLGDIGPESPYNSVSLSLDGKHIAASELGKTLAIMILDPVHQTANYMRAGGAGLNPVWSPDASTIAYGALRGVPELFIQNSNGTGGESTVLVSGKPKAPTSWSADGRFLLFQEKADSGRWLLWTLAMTGERIAKMLLPPTSSSANGQFSPDGQWVAYAAAESALQQIYIQSYPLGRGKWQITRDGGDQPRWRRDGKELFYVDPAGKMMSVEVKIGNGLVPGQPKPLFVFRGSNNPYGTFRYDVSPDGRKFLIVTPVEDTALDPLHVVLNWTAGIKSR